ncbi:SDR family oxidoreductase [Gluconacetobacter asukensis]|uniref:SDR family oxidoreductase n=1 Tax=Gluconacetobacter asukensis TaxID=1017181 RepID=UPI001C805322
MSEKPVALVTGATSGIGFAIVEILATDHDVIACGRSKAGLERLAAIPHVRPVYLDLTDPASFPPLVAHAPRLDVLVHSAAISERHTLEQGNPAAWQTSFAMNVFAPAELTRIFLPALRATRGQVVFIGSGAGTRAVPGHIIYSATKFALRAMADALRLEEVDNGLRVATVAPGPTATPMNRADRDPLDTDEPHLARGSLSDPKAHAAAVRLVVDAPPDSQVTEITVRPRRL